MENQKMEKETFWGSFLHLIRSKNILGNKAAINSFYRADLSQGRENSSKIHTKSLP